MTMSENTQLHLYPEPSEPVRRVLEKLKDVRRLCLGYYRAPCPLEQGHLLTVTEAVDERALVECDGCCWLDDLLPALGLRLDDLFVVLDDVYLGSEAPAYPPQKIREIQVRSTS